MYQRISIFLLTGALPFLLTVFGSEAIIGSENIDAWKLTGDPLLSVEIVFGSDAIKG